MLKGFPIEMRGDGNASPVLVDLAGNDTNQLIVANSDGIIHAYQYDASGGKVSDLPGWPVHTDPLPLHTGEHAFTSGEVSTAHYGSVIEAPAAGDLFGDGRKEIVADDMQGHVYAWDSTGKLVFHQTSNPDFSGAPLAGNPSWEAERSGARDRTAIGFVTSPVLGSVLSFANGRVYAINASGASPATQATGGFSCTGSSCTASDIRSGWPVKVGLIDAGLLPDVGEGIDGSPVVAPLNCPEGGEGPKIGVLPDAGPGYVLNADGSSCYGEEEGKYNALQTDFSAGNGKTDTPAFPAVGEPAFGTLDGATTNFFGPVAGLLRALDVVAPDYQKGSQDFTASWQANSGQFSPGYPAVNNDLSFITGQTVGDVTGQAPKQEVVAGTASQDLQAYNVEGNP